MATEKYSFTGLDGYAGFRHGKECELEIEEREDGQAALRATLGQAWENLD